jgi:hypothetical protein
MRTLRAHSDSSEGWSGPKVMLMSARALTARTI